MFNLLKNPRRNFIGASAASITSLAIPQVLSAAASKTKKIELNNNDVILFQGDSITDWGRSRTETSGPTIAALGNGYAFLTSAKLLKQYPEKNLTLFNRGISGNKVYQLADRWDADCLNLKPNVLSIMIGVNDFWHTLTNGYKGTVEVYRADYIKLLDRTKQALPDVKLVIGEPFFVNGIRKEDAQWHPAFDEYQKAAREIADMYHAAFIPYQSIFNDAIKLAPPIYWVRDGVHPGIAGQSLMTQALLGVFKG